LIAVNFCLLMYIPTQPIIEEGGDTIFSEFENRPNQYDTTIIKMISADTAIVKVRDGGKDFYIVRQKQ
jgi:hypothetical protein